MKTAEKPQHLAHGTTLVASLLAVVVTSGCDEAPRRSEPYIAFEQDFREFRSWEKLDLGEAAPSVGRVHDAGHRVEYIKARPPKGTGHFPVGTIIVKESISALGKQIFAMVKRGGSYNEGGAVGWEWLELEDRPSGSAEIEWRGLSAPPGEGYGGPEGDCNTCHARWRANDFVGSEQLKLMLER